MREIHHQGSEEDMKAKAVVAELEENIRRCEESVEQAALFVELAESFIHEDDRASPCCSLAHEVSVQPASSSSSVLPASAGNTWEELVDAERRAMTPEQRHATVRIGKPSR